MSDENAWFCQTTRRLRRTPEAFHLAHYFPWLKWAITDKYQQCLRMQLQKIFTFINMNT